MDAVILFVLALGASAVHGSHFRGGTINWKPVRDSPNQISLTYKFGFRHSYEIQQHTPCTQETKGTETELKTEGTLVCEKCDNGVDKNIRDPYTMKWHCTDFSPEDMGDWDIGEETLTLDVPNGMTSFVVSFEHCCWVTPLISPAVGSDSTKWKMMTEVNLRSHPDGGINSSPITQPIPVQLFHSGCTYHLEIPVTDPDNDATQCRYSNLDDGECPGGNRALCGETPYVTIHENCTLTFDTSGGEGYYAVRVMIEDLGRSSNVLSKVSLSFLLQVSYDRSTCETPKIVFPSTVCKTIPVGNPFEVTVLAEATSSRLPIVRIDTNKPAGMKVSELQSMPENPLGKSVILSWTPTRKAIERQPVVGFNAIDKEGFVSGWSFLYLNVADIKPLRPLPDQSSPSSGEQVEAGATWTVKFNRNVERPKHSAFITIFDNAGTIVDKLDSSKPEQVKFSGRVIKFYPDLKGVLHETHDYRLKIGEGVAVEAHEECFLDSNPAEWAVSVLDTPEPANPYEPYKCATGTVDVSPPETDDADKCFIYFENAGFALPQNSISVPYKVCCEADCDNGQTLPAYPPGGPPGGPPGDFYL